MGDLAVSAVSVFFAEMADKSQLVVLTIAAGVRLVHSLVVLVATIAVLQTVSVTVGAVIGALLLGDMVAVLTGAMFVVFGLWMWWSSMSDDPHDEAAPGVPQRSLVAMGAVFFVAEIGDKTMLTTAALAADRGVGAVWLGSFLGMVVAVGVAVCVGRTLVRYLSPRTTRRLSAVVFMALGVATIGAATIS